MLGRMLHQIDMWHNPVDGLITLDLACSQFVIDHVECPPVRLFRNSEETLRNSYFCMLRQHAAWVASQFATVLRRESGNTATRPCNLARPNAHQCGCWANNPASLFQDTFPTRVHCSVGLLHSVFGVDAHPVGCPVHVMHASDGG